MPSNITTSARLALAAETSVPAWMIAQQQEALAAEYLGENRLNDPRCPRCFVAVSKTGECFCG